MTFQIISVLFLILIAVGQYFLVLYLDREKLGRLKWILLSILLLSVGFTVFSSYEQFNEKQQTEKDNEMLHSEVKMLEGQHYDLLEDNLVLLKNFDILMAGQDTILAEVRTNNSQTTTNIIVPLSEKKLAEIEDKRETFIDSATGLHHALFVFRSRNVVPLRDIRIRMTFEKPIIRSEGRIRGAFVTEQGTSESLDSFTQYSYRTGYLSHSNDIIINVTSKTPIQLSKLDISP